MRSSRLRWRRRSRRCPWTRRIVVVYGTEQAPAVLRRERRKRRGDVVGELGTAREWRDWPSGARRTAGECGRSARRADDTLGRVLPRSHALPLVVPFRHAVRCGHHSGPRSGRACALHLRQASPPDPRPGRRAPDVAARVRRDDGRTLRAGGSVDGGRRDGVCARRHRLLAALGLPPATDDDRLVAAAAERLGFDRAELSSTLSQARASTTDPDLTARQAVPLVAQLQGLVARLEGAGRGRKRR